MLGNIKGKLILTTTGWRSSLVQAYPNRVAFATECGRRNSSIASSTLVNPVQITPFNHYVSFIYSHWQFHQMLWQTQPKIILTTGWRSSLVQAKPYLGAFAIDFGRRNSCIGSSPLVNQVLITPFNHNDSFFNGLQQLFLQMRQQTQPNLFAFTTGRGRRTYLTSIESSVLVNPLEINPFDHNVFFIHDG